MSKILLVAINACYNHTNLAVRTINEYIDKCSDENWEEIANKLSRYFAWEFEDYQP